RTSSSARRPGSGVTDRRHCEIRVRQNVWRIICASKGAQVSAASAICSAADPPPPIVRTSPKTHRGGGEAETSPAGRCLMIRPGGDLDDERRPQPGEQLGTPPSLVDDGE